MLQNTPSFYHYVGHYLAQQRLQLHPFAHDFIPYVHIRVVVPDLQSAALCELCLHLLVRVEENERLEFADIADETAHAEQLLVLAVLSHFLE